MEAIIVIGIGIAVGMIGTIFSLFLLPLLAGRVAFLKNTNTTTGGGANLSQITGATDMLDLIIYSGIFSSVVVSFGIIFIGLKMMKN